MPSFHLKKIDYVIRVTDFFRPVNYKRYKPQRYFFIECKGLHSLQNKVEMSPYFDPLPVVVEALKKYHKWQDIYANLPDLETVAVS